ncbi:hypothetical protein EPR50_G00230550 [Perca flavescens]|uniref:Uncharacterized protein n=1 Tax=Perca flavescens TaxID=8167 RepID=A0A484BZH5_PERFV|nr:hypothetical protein EPR50_G00230550 [Perca flavescens]
MSPLKAIVLTSSLLCEHLDGIAAFFLFGVTGGNWKQGVLRGINKIQIWLGNWLVQVGPALEEAPERQW